MSYKDKRQRFSLKKYILSLLVLISAFPVFCIEYKNIGDVWPPEKNTVSSVKSFIINNFTSSAAGNEAVYSTDSIWKFLCETPEKKKYIITFIDAFNLPELESFAGNLLPNSSTLFQNLQKNDEEIVMKLIAKYSSWRIKGMVFAVEYDNFAVAGKCLKYISKDTINDIHPYYYYTPVNEVLSGKYKNESDNLLTIAKSESMKQLLLINGVLTEIPASQPVSAQVTDYYINVRDKPSLDGNKIAKKHKGDFVEIYAWDCYEYEIDGEKGQWVKIKLDNDKYGWIFGAYLQEVGN